MAEPLPNWVYDVLGNLLEQQSVHPRLLADYAFGGIAAYDWCPCRPLDFVPDDVMDRARAIAAYRKAEKDKESGDA